jgi:hypothetical protein
LKKGVRRSDKNEKKRESVGVVRVVVVMRVGVVVVGGEDRSRGRIRHNSSSFSFEH